ncbi:MAG: family 78 glycoside hydrolase catalytic domain [Propionicimonas sp.]|uniref:family 78 glycoside hydrolase catalytic domain n=1 Tax=Propionicimonas sp. TaxID=1955623 RepID=UPI003D144A53
MSDNITGLLSAGTFLTADADRGAVVEFATALDLDQPAERVSSATIHATAHGLYELTVGGRPVTDSVFNPGWTAYEWRLQFQSFDITDLVRGSAGPLPLAVRVGNGWWRGDFGFEGLAANYGEDLGLLAVVVIDFADGHRQVVGTSTDWTASTCEITGNSLYHGQLVDARLRGVPGQPLEVRAGTFDAARLVAQAGPLVRRHEVLAPQAIWTSPSGRTLVDFGQNLVGWVRVRVRGPVGTTVTLRHAEVLEHDELGTRPLREARATDTYVLSGGEDHFEPTFTFHGFRYVEVEGWPGVLDASALEAVVVHSDLTPTMRFECSEPLVNQLVHNSVWGQKGNFLAVPTDCPQRDERLGWTGDIAVYAPTACAQFDTADFLHSWLLDVAEETVHHDPPAVPVVVPDILKYGHYPPDAPFSDVHSQAIWSDAAAWVPQALWQAYGDRDRLAAHYPGLVAHVASIEPLLSPSGLWDAGMQLADWLDPDAPPDQPWAAKADPGVVATASFHRSVAFAAEAAAILGKDDDAARWTALADRLRTAFRAHYVTVGPAAAPGTSGRPDEPGELRITSDCATVYALAICFGLLEDTEVPGAAQRLAEVVRARDHLVTTGFAGTPFVTWALAEHGYAADAYRLLLQTGCPSWLYPVTMGATTIWERWDSMLPDGTINPGGMTSFNHYALGAVCDWLYAGVAGIRPAEAGFARVLVQPTPGPGIDWVRAARTTPVGEVEVAWQVEGEAFRLEVALPDGVRADVVLPDGTRVPQTGGRHDYTCALAQPDTRENHRE